MCPWWSEKTIEHLPIASHANDLFRFCEKETVVMHITTSKTKRIIFAPVLKTIAWMTPRFPKLVAKIRYFERFKKRIHLNPPRDLNEKILWQEIYADTSLWTRCADKYEVRKYVEECGLGNVLVPFYGVWDKAEAVDFDLLPQSFAIKSTSGSGGNLFVKDKTVYSREIFNECIQTLLEKKLSLTGIGDLHYIPIKNRIMAEGLIENDETSKKYSETLIDYKIWCLNGKAEYIWVCMNRFVKNKDGAEAMTYDRDWNPHPEYCHETSDFSLANYIPKPANLEYMLEVAERLSAPFPVVRCDMYNLNGTIIFGELTFSSLGGMMDFYTQEFLDLCGSKIDLSKIALKNEKYRQLLS